MGVAVFRDMQALGEPRGLSRLPHLLTRVPSLNRVALDYLAEVAKDEMEEATAVFLALLDSRRFMLDVEKLNLFAAVLKLPERKALDLADSLGEWALKDAHDLVRARALLAWGAQSPARDLQVADEFWRMATTPWQPYALIAIQNKAEQSRNSRYRRWSGEERFTGELVNAIEKGTFAWRKL